MWRMPRQQFWREALTLSAVAMLLLLIEMLGRLNRSETFDAASGLVLILAVAMTVSWHRRLRLRWTGRLALAGRRLWKSAQCWRFEWGLDLRREPPVPRGVPPALCVLPLSLLGLCIAAVIWAAATGMPLRVLVVQASYVVYAAGLMTLWAGLLTVLIVSAFLPAWTIMDMVKSHTRWPERKAARWGAIGAAAFFTLVLAAALLLPAWVATALLSLVVLIAVTLPWAPQTWYPDCLWRNRAGDDREVRSISLGALFSLQLVSVSLIPLALVLLALGPEAIGLTASGMASPISSALGRVTAWLAGGGLLVFLGLLAGHLGVARWYDPSRRADTSVHVSGVEDADARSRIRQKLARQRWRVRFAPQQPRRTDVTVHVGEQNVEGEGTSGATFHVSEAELDNPRWRARIARRDVIQRRRMLTRGLQSIFKRAARRKKRSGSGYWVAPHYWFVDGLTRDQFDDEDTNVLDVIPPLYYKAFPRAARRHFFEICRALEVDLIYVEDGVDFRNLRRVLRVMFERYDIDGGRQPLADIHFAGLPKVRVMLHDYDFQEPPLKTKYPEPDYQHLGRVRILHVFRDRGADDEQATTPEEPDWILTPDESPILVG